MKVINSIVEALRGTAVFNPDAQVAPACILWPDKDRQWEAAVPRLQEEMPELLVYGEYAPERRCGPAIWLRCVIANRINEVVIPAGLTPILYLPGVSRQELRAVESCPELLKPLAELQYRGVLWSQVSARDWTILAFMVTKQGGLGLDVAQDNATKNAMQVALYPLLDEDVVLLQGKRLDKDFFNTLLTGGDLTRDLLKWLDQGEAFKERRSENEWRAFVDVCQSQLAFNPESEGVLSGSAKLANREGPWMTVFERYSETSGRYANIPTRLRQCVPPNFDLFDNVETAAGWPQWNEQQESSLRNDLLGVAGVKPYKAGERLIELEKQHGARRALVWAERGEANLACALKHLSKMAMLTKNGLAAGSVEELSAGYRSFGWQVDNEVLRALATVETHEELEAVTKAIKAIYQPWLEESARYLQKSVDGGTYPGGTCQSVKSAKFDDGVCVLFVDGLRFDLGKRLADVLSEGGFDVQEEVAWAALPSVTATGKPAVTPVRDKIVGAEGNIDFEPMVAATGQSLKGGYHLKKLLAADGWTLLDGNNGGDGQGSAWCDFGNIDHEGHGRGWRLAKHVDGMIMEIKERVAGLLAAGWSSVRVVTDHGWLLLPGGLPKVELASVLTESKWGRCAALKPGSICKERLYPWFWNASHHFALADGISCFKNGAEYAHGGLSLQECLTLQLTVVHGADKQTHSGVGFGEVVWRGLRCSVVVETEGAADTEYGTTGLSLDIRTQPGNPASSIVLSTKSIENDKVTSVVVENEDLEGQVATVVLLDAGGGLVAQMPTIIGGGGR